MDATRPGRLPIALLGLCICIALCATAVSTVFAAGTTTRPCSTSNGERRDCGRTEVFAHASDSEAEEPEEEVQEGSEEAASAEAEAEEAESEAGASSASEDHAGSVAVSNLRLTARATAALAHHLPSASAVAFSFTLSAPTSVHVTIVRQTGTSGHGRWAMLPDSLTLSLARGRTAHALKGRNHLSAGRYRLTVKPSGGRSRSLYIDVRR
jgi:hypothetical protein